MCIERLMRRYYPLGTKRGSLGQMQPIGQGIEQVSLRVLSIHFPCVLLRSRAFVWLFVHSFKFVIYFKFKSPTWKRWRKWKGMSRVCFKEMIHVPALSALICETLTPWVSSKWIKRVDKSKNPTWTGRACIASAPSPWSSWRHPGSSSAGGSSRSRTWWAGSRSRCARCRFCPHTTDSPRWRRLQNKSKRRRGSDQREERQEGSKEFI